MTSTTKIVGLIASNRDTISENLSAFWSRWATDLASAGIDRGDVAQSLLEAAINEQIAVIGAEKFILLLEQTLAFHRQMSAGRVNN